MIGQWNMNALQGLSSPFITKLLLRGNSIAYIATQQFPFSSTQGLPAILELDVSLNALLAINSNAFLGFAALTSLTLPVGDAQMLQIFPGTFNTLPNLTRINSNIAGILNLSNTGAFVNAFGHFSMAALQGLSSPILTALFLQSNSITVINAQLSPTSAPLYPAITFLDVSVNPLNTLSVNAFAVFPTLVSLVLPLNAERKLQIFPGTFNNLGSLCQINSNSGGVLNLTNTGIFADAPGSWNMGALRGLTSLLVSTLMLQHNKIATVTTVPISLPTYLLPPLFGVELTSNPLQSVETNAFSGFATLTSLILPVENASQALQFFPGSFDGLSNLSKINSDIAGTLNLSNTGAFVGTLGHFSMAALRGLSSPVVTTLILLGNSIAVIDAQLSTSLAPVYPAIVSLDVSSNPLQMLSADAFAGFPTLKSLSLPFNSEHKLQIFPGTFNNLPHLNQINSGSIVGFLNLSQTGIFVGSPGSFSWDALQGLASRDIIQLGLDENAIRSIVPRRLPPPSFSSTLNSLTLTSNVLVSIDASYFAGFSGLISLALDRNNISFVAADTITSFQQPILKVKTFNQNPLPSSRCPPGFYNGLASISAGGLLPACIPCQAGSFCAGDATSQPCALNSYSSANALYCLPCPTGTSTSTVGASSILQCAAPSFAGCPASQQPRDITKPSSFDDCVALVCPPPLSPNSFNTSCVDSCGVGAYYSSTQHSCIPCSAQLLCPGFSVAIPATNSSGRTTDPTSPFLLSASSAAESLSSSSSSSSIPKVIDSCSAQIPTASGGATDGSSTFTAAVIADISVAGVIILVVCVVAFFLPDKTHSKSSDSTPPSSAPTSSNSDSRDAITRGSWQSSVLNCFKATDLFAVRTHKSTVVVARSKLGSVCTIAGIVTIVAVAVALIIRHSTDNVASAVALAILNPATLAGDQLATLTPSTSSSMHGAPWTGVRVRVFSLSATAAASAPIDVPSCSRLALVSTPFFFSGLVKGSWANESIPNCGDESTAALIFTCADCVFSSTSSLAFALPFQCQSLFIDAAAVTATGTLSLASFPMSASSAKADALLQTVSWTLATVFDYADNRVTMQSHRGLQLISFSQTSTYAPPSASSSELPSIQPLFASVAITIALPFQGYYSSTVLTEKISSLQLFSSIIGLAGLLGAFRFAHYITTHAARAPSSAAMQRFALSIKGKRALVRRASAVVSKTAANASETDQVTDDQGSAAGASVTVTNPVAAKGPSQREKGGAEGGNTVSSWPPQKSLSSS